MQFPLIRLSCVPVVLGLAVWLSATGVVAQPIDSYRADNEIRMMEMENQLRRVTGQYEEAMFRLTQVNRQLERSLEDMEFRIAQLEQRLENAGVAPIDPAVQGGTRPQAPGAPSGVASGNAATVSDAAPQGDIVIDGSAATLNRPDQILRLPGEGAGYVPSVPPGGAAANPQDNPSLFLEGETPEQQYEAAFAHLRRNDLAKAEGAFRGFLAMHPQHALAANSKYWLGKVYYAQGDFGQAAREFLEGYEQFADADKGADTLLHLGLSLSELGQPEDACAAFAELTDRYPNAAASITQRANAASQTVGCS